MGSSQTRDQTCISCTICTCLVTQSCLTLCNLMDCSPPGSSVHGDSPGKNTGAGCPALLQGSFPTQGWNPGLPHCRHILYQLSYQGSPHLLHWHADSLTKSQQRTPVDVFRMYLREGVSSISFYSTILIGVPTDS